MSPAAPPPLLLTCTQAKLERFKDHLRRKREDLDKERQAVARLAAEVPMLSWDGGGSLLLLKGLFLAW